jgi:hypothetical protein
MNSEPLHWTDVNDQLCSPAALSLRESTSGVGWRQNGCQRCSGHVAERKTSSFDVNQTSSVASCYADMHSGFPNMNRGRYSCDRLLSVIFSKYVYR